MAPLSCRTSDPSAPPHRLLTGLVLVGLSVLNVEIGRILEGGVTAVNVRTRD